MMRWRSTWKPIQTPFIPRPIPEMFMPGYPIRSTIIPQPKPRAITWTGTQTSGIDEDNVEFWKTLIDALWIMNGCKDMMLRKGTLEEWLRNRGYDDVNLGWNTDLMVVGSDQVEIDWNIELEEEDKDILDECHISREWMLNW